MSELSEFRPLLLLGPFLRRWYWIVLLAAAGGGVATVSPLLDPPRYGSYAVLLQGQSGGSGGGDLFTLASRLGIGGGGSGGDISGVYDEVIRSIAFTNRFAGREFPVGWDGRTTTLEKFFELPPVKDTLQHALGLNGVFAGRKGLVWKVQPNGTVKLSFQARDPVLAASVLQSVLDELQKYTMEMRSRGTTQKLAVTNRNLSDVASELQAAENRVAGFQRSNVALSPELSVRLARLQREARVLEQVYGTLRQSKATLDVERESYIPTFQIIETPRPSLDPAFKPLRKWVPIGIVLGGLLGFLIALAVAWRKGELAGVLSGAGA